MNRRICYYYRPDLCLEEDLSHAMANCFEALLGKFLEGITLGSWTFSLVLCMRIQLGLKIGTNPNSLKQ